MKINAEMPEGKPELTHQAIADWTMAVIRASSRKTIRPSCALVATALAVKFMNRKTGACFPKLETIAEETGLPLSTVKAALKLLKGAGFLQWGRAWFNGPSSYRFVTAESLAHETATDESGSLASEICEGLAHETSKPRIGTVKEKGLPHVPSPSTPSAHPAGGRNSIPLRGKQFLSSTSVVAPELKKDDFANANAERRTA